MPAGFGNLLPFGIEIIHFAIAEGYRVLFDRYHFAFAVYLALAAGRAVDFCALTALAKEILFAVYNFPGI